MRAVRWVRDLWAHFPKAIRNVLTLTVRGDR